MTAKVEPVFEDADFNRDLGEVLIMVCACACGVCRFDAVMRSDSIAMQSAQCNVKKKAAPAPGTLYLTNERLVWCTAGSGTPSIAVKYSAISCELGCWSPFAVVRCACD